MNRTRHIVTAIFVAARAPWLGMLPLLTRFTR